MKTHTTEKKRSAFTMLELIFAIVILGIFASLAIPRFDRDLRQSAIDTLLSSIRYTQHMALIDNRHDSSILWQRSFWTMRFQADGSFFTISSNINYGTNVSPDEAAIDPANGKLFYSNAVAGPQSDESPNIFLRSKFGINAVDFTACTVTANGVNGSSHIAFDYKGRPHKGVYGLTSSDYGTRMTADCSITFSFIDTSIANIVMTINRETGYAFIVGQNF